jgi:hypothetical protein
VVDEGPAPLIDLVVPDDPPEGRLKVTLKGSPGRHQRDGRRILWYGGKTYAVEWHIGGGPPWRITIAGPSHCGERFIR